MSLIARMDGPGPKKLLSLDGGGIHGLISIEILAEMERTLRATLGRGEDFVLADYFDYIAGTSTGAIIATCLSLGMPVDTIRDFYLRNARDMFRRSGLRFRYLYKYADRNLRRILQETIGADTQLGTEKLRTLLMMVLRNATTDSPWPVSNNPRAAYNRPDLPDCNLRLPLWQLVRASTAAPTFFPPETVALGPRRFVFVDGAVTMYNNPAFQLFLMATLNAYRLNWEAGEDRLLLVSVGTGASSGAKLGLRPAAMHLLYHATRLPLALLASARQEQDALCRIFGRCRCGEAIDSELGDLSGEEAGGVIERKLFTYLRYDVALERPAIEALGLRGIRVDRLRAIDCVGAMDDLRRVGEAASGRVRADHFAGFPASPPRRAGRIGAGPVGGLARGRPEARMS